MPETRQSVNDSVSLTEDSQDRSQSDEGKNPSDIEKRVRENLRREYERKLDEKTRDLQSQIDRLIEDKEIMLSEIKNKSRLTEEDREEILDLESQIHSIKKDPRSKAWMKLNEEISDSRARQIFNRFDVDMTMDYVSELADKEGVSQPLFEKEIAGWMRKVDPGAEMSTLRRAKLAYKSYLEDKKYHKRLAELDDKEKQFSESGQRTSRPQSNSDIMKNALKSDSSLERALKLVAESQAG